MDHEAKLAWAYEQTEALKSEINSWLGKGPMSARVDIDREGQRIDVFPQMDVAMPHWWPLKIGDIVHNLRCSLDHIAWFLSMRRNLAVKRRQEIRQIQFPICTDKGEYWSSQRDRRTKFIEDFARAEIDALQPCNRTDGASDILATLNELANEDKHHQLILTVLSVDVPELRVAGLPLSQRKAVYNGPQSPESETPILSIFYDGEIGPGTNVKVQAETGGLIVFGDMPGIQGGLEVVDLLEAVHDFIRDEVFPRFEHFMVPIP